MLAEEAALNKTLLKMNFLELSLEEFANIINHILNCLSISS